MIIILFVLFGLYIIAHFCDYIYQADDHGWWLPSWYSRERKHRVWYLDWLPSDMWHCLQTIRNFIWINTTALFAGLFYYHVRWWFSVIIITIINLIARGIGFSLMLKIYNKK